MAGGPNFGLRELSNEKNPFTIKLLYDSSRYTQSVPLRVDTGSKSIGLSASSEDKELLAWDVQNRTDVTELISTRREARKTRRNRKTRYRAPRFNNRVRTKHSVEGKIGTHLHCIQEGQKILPATRIVVETASFDTQKLKKPEISGTEHQNGDQKGFWNVREYVLFRDNHECQHCHGKINDPVLNVHHIESRKTGVIHLPT